MNFQSMIAATRVLDWVHQPRLCMGHEEQITLCSTECQAIVPLDAPTTTVAEFPSLDEFAEPETNATHGDAVDSLRLRSHEA